MSQKRPIGIEDKSIKILSDTYQEIKAIIAKKEAESNYTIKYTMNDIIKLALKK